MQISESGLLKISAVGVAVGLFLLYFISANQQIQSLEIGKIDSDFVGKSVNITGTVDDFRKTDSGLFFNLVEGEKKIKVVLWNNIVEQLELKGFDTKDIKDGVKINLVGLVGQYKGSLEVIPAKAEVRII